MSKYIPKSFQATIFNQPTFGGKKSAAKKAYYTNNKAPANFKPAGIQKQKKG